MHAMGCSMNCRVSVGEGRTVFSEILHRVTREHIRTTLSGIGGIFSSLVLSVQFQEDLEAAIVSAAHEEMENIWPLAYKHIEDAMDMRETLRTKLQALPPREFVGTLRPVFQEDEVKLIVVGAILGMVVGFLQQFLIFHWI